MSATLSTLALLLLTTLALPATAASPCEKLANISDRPAPEKADTVFGAMFAINPQASPGADTNNNFDLFFTIRSNYSIQPNCLTSGGSTRENGLYYPIGLIVRKLGTAMIGGGAYDLVEADHGLRMYIPDADLAKVDPDKVYFFANSHMVIPYCAPNRNCPFTSSVPSDDTKASGLHPRLKWAAAKKDDIKGDVTLFGMTSCEPVPVQIFNRGTSSSEGAAKLPICVQPNAQGLTGPDGRIKVVTEDIYRKIFNTDVWGAYVRFSNGVLQAIFDKVLEAKGCGWKRITRISSTAKAGIEGDFDVYFAKFGLKAQAEFLATQSRELGEKHFIHYGTYVINLGDSPNRPVEKLAIQSMFICDENTLEPDKPAKIVFYHPKLSNEGEDMSFLIDREAMKEAYGVIDTNLAIAAPIRTDHVWKRRGKLWEISDHLRFFGQREALRNHLRNNHNTAVQILRGSNINQFRRARVESLLLHLTLAAATRFKCTGGAGSGASACPEEQ